MVPTQGAAMSGITQSILTFSVTILVATSPITAFAKAYVYSDNPHNLMEWPKLQGENLRTEIQFHQKRVVVLAMEIATLFGVSPELVRFVAEVHDNAKLTEKNFAFVESNYQQSVSEDDPRLKELNTEDDRITNERLKQSGLLNKDGSLTPIGKIVILIIHIADKTDRFKYPEIVAKAIFGTSKFAANSPEFGRLMSSMTEYVDVEKFSDKYNFHDYPKVYEAIQHLETHHEDLTRNLIPKQIYGLMCRSLF